MGSYHTRLDRNYDGVSAQETSSAAAEALEPRRVSEKPPGTLPHREEGDAHLGVPGHLEPSHTQGEGHATATSISPPAGGLLPRSLRVPEDNPPSTTLDPEVAPLGPHWGSESCISTRSPFQLLGTGAFPTEPPEASHNQTLDNHAPGASPLTQSHPGHGGLSARGLPGDVDLPSESGPFCT